jgi:hypothetical protein
MVNLWCLEDQQVGSGRTEMGRNGNGDWDVDREGEGWGRDGTT